MYASAFLLIEPPLAISANLKAGAYVCFLYI